MRKEKSQIALHGFLGRPADWEFLPEAQTVDLFREEPAPFDQWAENFCDTVTGTPLLIGYSLGARLALHALLLNPTLFRGAVLISCHPGLTPKERPQRIESDARWANRFLSEPWDPLMRAWNGQEVFQGESLRRDEQDFKRSHLAAALNVWSFGRQEDLKEKIASLQLPLLWIAGERDTKFSALASGMKFASNLSEIWIAPESGHRVPWALKEKLRTKIQRFEENL